MKRFGILAVAVACTGYLLASPAFSSDVDSGSVSSSATGTDAGAIAGIISISVSGDDPVAVSTHISVAIADDGDASASTSGSSSATARDIQGGVYEAVTGSGTSAHAVATEPDPDQCVPGLQDEYPSDALIPLETIILRSNHTAVAIGIHGAGIGAGGPVGAGGALSLSGGYTDDAAGLATATTNGAAQATYTPPGAPDPTATFSIRNVDTATRVWSNAGPLGFGTSIGGSAVFAGGVATVVPIPLNITAAGLDSVALTAGVGSFTGGAATMADGTAHADITGVGLLAGTVTYTDAAGHTDASAQHNVPGGIGLTVALAGKDAVAVASPAIPSIGVSALFAGTYGAGGGFQVDSEANAINDPPGPRWTIDPAAFASSPNGETYAEIGALYGTAQANSNLESAGDGAGQAVNVAAAIALGLADSSGPPLEVAAIGLVTFAGAEGTGTLPVNDANLQNIYGNVYADALGADEVRNSPPYENVTWAALRNADLYATAPDLTLPRQARASIGELEAWGNPGVGSIVELAIGIGIVPPGNYWAAGVGLGLGVSTP